MTSPSALACVDTNVLVYAHFNQSPQHAASSTLLDDAQAGKVELCITPQIIAEFYSVVTNPRRVSSPFTSADALDAVDILLAMPGVTLLPFPSDLATELLALLRQHPVTGRGIFDLQLIVTLLAHSVRRIYTFDRAHFEWHADLTVVTPT